MYSMTYGMRHMNMIAAPLNPTATLYVSVCSTHNWSRGVTFAHQFVKNRRSTQKLVRLVSALWMHTIQDYLLWIEQRHLVLFFEQQGQLWCMFCALSWQKTESRPTVGPFGRSVLVVVTIIMETPTHCTPYDIWHTAVCDACVWVHVCKHCTTHGPNSAQRNFRRRR